MKSSRLGDRISSCDSFGARIGINYRGMTTYKTLGGGLATLILKATMLGFLVE